MHWCMGETVLTPNIHATQPTWPSFMLDEFTFSQSYERIFGREVKIGPLGDQFFDYFYSLFLASSPDVRAAFKNTDMEKQKKMLKRSLLYSINFIENKNNFHSMERIAISHSRKHHNIKPHLYDLWMDCMVASVECFDPKFDCDVELAWRLAFSPGITYMKYQYDK